jgi:hypothetical protein
MREKSNESTKPTSDDKKMDFKINQSQTDQRQRSH